MIVAHIECKILVLSLEGAERHQRRYRRVYLVGAFFFVRLDVGVGVRLHNHITHCPRQNRITTMTHNPAVDEYLKGFRYRAEPEIGLRERLHIEASSL